MDTKKNSVEQQAIKDYDALKQFLKQTESILSCKDISIHEADYKIIVTVNLSTEILKEA